MEREEGREERAEKTGLGCVGGSLGGVKSMENELQKLQDEALRHQKPFPEASRTCEGPLETLWGLPLDAPGSALGPLWGEVLGALQAPGDAFGMLFWVQGACHSKNTEHLEFDSLLVGFAMF